ncbi:type ISP restriction/modification enzyme [uncultured Draconibacterium sp.]|uniref:type ISP restriction/modification enzyme n=1 Tax=uncultured Draconibacterium sp. TaxID=1573823 RepID=UPI0029C8C2FB|nr:type ISP restriction/modification enzyme [uncultured Draconibacterium sp.]
MTVSEYLAVLNNRFQSGISSEHTYRGDLESLIRSLVTEVEITNEPSKVTDCGNPDYVITKGKIPVGYIEAKDIGKDLNHKQYKEQFTRYKNALDNLIITDYLWFQFFKEGELVHEIRIGEINGNSINPLTENLTNFENLVRDFCTYVGQTIRSGKKLAGMMAAKARLLQNIVERALTADNENDENSTLNDQYESFKNILIHDLTPKGFADIYAQTLAYGMFAARYHDQTPEDFSRYEAAELIPKTNPFLKKLFTYIAGPDIDERIKRTVDNLALVFRAVNLDALLHNFGRSTQTHDPIIHFYETFLAEYDAKLRKARGVWYTPEPVVNFIVRAVDDILKTEFDLPQGLADTAKTKIKVPVQGSKKMQELEVHKVQVLDPATGTGTFLAEVVKHIYHTKFKSMQGAWSAYVDEHLIPRLNGFELLMASYAMAHLKLDMLLHDTGYKYSPASGKGPAARSGQQRFNIYLTNSLEEHHPDTGTLWANWLSTEANEANHIKRDTPVMCVIGNPPYSVSSTNKSEWIQGLLKDYKKDLNERKINLDDDYIKFIRYGQYYIEKNGEGILAYISNNSFIDGITHRQMRKNLMETFDKIYILDLHGNSKKKETAPDGSPDKNVFDIMQGVSINLFVKSNKKEPQVLHYDVFGSRKGKYDFLDNNSINSIEWNELEIEKQYNFFVPKDFEQEENYNQGFKLNDLLPNNNTGIQTKRDALVYNFNKENLLKILEDFKNLNYNEIRTKYSLPNDGRDWTISYAKKDLVKEDGSIVSVLYHPFDYRITYFTGRSKGFMAYPRCPLSLNCRRDNISLLAVRNSRRGNVNNFFVTNLLVDKDGVSPFDNCKFFPLYLYPQSDDQQQAISQQQERIPNLNTKIVQQIAKAIGLTFTPEVDTSTSLSVTDTFAPIDILDYIYAVLHSPTYRTKYKEFLKIDFPRVPYPKNTDTFWKLVKLGGELRQIHLLESPKVEQPITTYPEAGTNEVEKPQFKMYDYDCTPPGEEHPVYLGDVYINSTQYFANVPQSAWEFYIGGYQPAQKWLKDRKGRTLTFEDIMHYQKIIVALTETGRLMKDVDLVGVE